MKIVNNISFPIEAMPLYGPGGKPVLTVVVKGTFDLVSMERAKVASEQIPVAFGDEFYDEKRGDIVKFESDVAPFKPRADIVLVGKAHAPGERMVQAFDVSLRVGQIIKEIRVIGDRHWDCSGRAFPDRHSFAHPFKIMDLTYERAFGGMDKEGGDWCRENPVGRGFISRTSKKVLDGTLLPNLEDPRKLIKDWKDHPQPVNFGFSGRGWMPRMGYVGTYDDKWRQTRSPTPPEDFRFEFYNAAHPDLQVKGYLKGDEEVELLNLTPEGTLRFQLSGISPACTVTKSLDPQAGANEALDREEVPLNLDTLCLISEERRLFQIWRGICPIKDLTAAEIKAVEINWKNPLF